MSARSRWNWTAPIGKSGHLKGSYKKSVWLTALNIDFQCTANLMGRLMPLYWLEDYVLIGFEGGMGG